MATEMMRYHENITLDKQLHTATGPSPTYGFGRFSEMCLFVSAVVAQGTKAVEFKEVQEGYDGQNQTYLLNVGSADGGTFDIGIADDMQTVAATANSAAIQTELRKITGDGWSDVTVAGTTPGDFTITIPLELESVTLVADFDGLTEDAGTPTTPATLAEDDEYKASIDTIHTYEVKNADGGTFTITHDGDTTSSLAWDVSGADFKAAIVALKIAYTNENVSVVVTEEGRLYTVTFDDMFIDKEDVSTAPASLTQSAVTLDAVPQVLMPGTSNWVTLTDPEGDPYLAQYTAGTTTRVAVVPINGDGFRLNYTIAGVGPLCTITASATVKA